MPSDNETIGSNPKYSIFELSNATRGYLQYPSVGLSLAKTTLISSPAIEQIICAI